MNMVQKAETTHKRNFLFEVQEVAFEGQGIYGRSSLLTLIQ
jgi:hypothetical protein